MRTVELIGLPAINMHCKMARQFSAEQSIEVFKLWVATQTWVAMAFSFGRGLFHDQN